MMSVWRRRWRAIALGLVLGAGAATTGAQPDEACPRHVRDALTSWGQDGVHRAASVIRSEDAGIGKPTSVFDFSCITDLFEFDGLFFFFDPSTIVDAVLGAMRDFVCEVGEQLYAQAIGKPMRQLVFWDEAPQVPGLATGVRWTDEVPEPRWRSCPWNGWARAPIGIFGGSVALSAERSRQIEAPGGGDRPGPLGSAGGGAVRIWV